MQIQKRIKIILFILKWMKILTAGCAAVSIYTCIYVGIETGESLNIYGTMALFEGLCELVLVSISDRLKAEYDTKEETSKKMMEERA